MQDGHEAELRRVLSSELQQSRNLHESPQLVPTQPQLSPDQAADFIRRVSQSVVTKINNFIRITFVTRGGRMGSGMGLLLEGLWGYYMSQALVKQGIEIAWIVDNQYNDYACVDMTSDWNPETRAGELFRIEAKTMNLGADESKGHFAELARFIDPNDLLLVMTWRWIDSEDGRRCYPQITETFLERALPLANLRDALHLARGGSFVSAEDCPDGCDPSFCSHVGEPLNERGKRERLSGPQTRRPSAKVSFAANFGGLFRMIGTRSVAAKAELARQQDANPIAAKYVDFVNRSRGRRAE